MSDNAGEKIVRTVESSDGASRMIDSEPTAITGSAYDARLAVDTTPEAYRSNYDAKVSVETSPPVRMEPVTTSTAGSSAAAGQGTSAPE